MLEDSRQGAAHCYGDSHCTVQLQTRISRESPAALPVGDDTYAICKRMGGMTSSAATLEVLAITHIIGHRVKFISSRPLGRAAHWPPGGFSCIRHVRSTASFFTFVQTVTGTRRS